MPEWCKLDLRAPRWRSQERGPTRLWFRGYLYDTTPDLLLANLADPGFDEHRPDFSGLRGHFALVASCRERDWVLAAVDHVRSIPLAFARSGDGWLLGDISGEVAKRLGLGPDDVDPRAARAIAMAGYTIGDDVLYRPLKMLLPGQSVVLGKAGAERHRYHVFQPWRVEERDRSTLKAELKETTLDVLERMSDSTDGRPIVVPLSGGLDSRLVASGLRHLGRRDVRCFSYGIRGGHEALVAQRVAARLGYDWTFVPYTVKSQRAWFSSPDHEAYLAFADTCAATPFESDLPAIRYLEESGWLPEGSVIINGQSGDFISGNHIHPALHAPGGSGGARERERLVIRSLLRKHFRLWDVLVDPEADAMLEEALHEVISEIEAPLDDPDTLHGVYEFCEFQDRQAKYVINGQRIYDFADYDWRLPLWDPAYLDFWQGVPLSAKVNQVLYRETLDEANWGGVWGDELRLGRPRRPRRVLVPRFGLQKMFDLVWPEAWDRLDRRVFTYWKWNTLGHSYWPYRQVLMDGRGARHSVSWWTEHYLNSKGLSFSGEPLKDAPRGAPRES